MAETFTQIYHNNAHDPQCSIYRDELFRAIFTDELNANEKYILPYTIIRIAEDGAIRDITDEYQEYVSSMLEAA